MRGEFRDLVTKALQLSSARSIRGNDGIRSDAEIVAHRRNLHLLLHRLYREIFDAPEGYQDARLRSDPNFFERWSSASPVAATRASERLFSIDYARTPGAHGEACQESKIGYT